jgi:hypothetical protein
MQTCHSPGTRGDGGAGLGSGFAIKARSSTTLHATTITYRKSLGGNEGAGGSDGFSVGGGVYNLGTFTPNTASLVNKNEPSTTNPRFDASDCGQEHALPLPRTSPSLAVVTGSRLL